VTRKLTALFAAIALLAPVAAAGCGGGSDSNGSSGGGSGLSTEENLKVDQDRADIEEFCSVATVGKGDLYDRALFSVVAAVDDLQITYKKHPDAVYHEPIKNRDIKMKQLVADMAKKLDGCGKDGKQQSQKLTQALQTS
jgi:hypothetical protein